MAVPKRKHSTRRKGKRRAAINLKLPTLIPCSNCGEPKKPHQVCPHCGFYKSSGVVEKQNKEAKKKEK